MSGIGLSRRALLAAAALVSTPASAETLQRFVIGSGPAGGVYAAIGRALAVLISDTGRSPCHAPFECGVPGIAAQAIETAGSVRNIAGLRTGELDVAIVQADVAYWASRAAGPFSNDPPNTWLSAIAHLHDEEVHAVVDRDARVESIADLRGKAVALDLQGSGSYFHAISVLEAHGLTEAEIEPVYAAPAAAIRLLVEGRVTGMFATVGAPVNWVEPLRAAARLTLLPIAGAERSTLVEKNPFFNPATIAAAVYGLGQPVETVAVPAVLVTSRDQRPDLVQNMAAALWTPRARGLLEAVHPKGAQVYAIRQVSAGIPYHDGALRFYQAAGVRR